MGYSGKLVGGLGRRDQIQGERGQGEKLLGRNPEDWGKEEMHNVGPIPSNRTKTGGQKKRGQPRRYRGPFQNPIFGDRTIHVNEAGGRSKTMQREQAKKLKG